MIAARDPDCLKCAINAKLHLTDKSGRRFGRTAVSLKTAALIVRRFCSVPAIYEKVFSAGSAPLAGRGLADRGGDDDRYPNSEEA